MNSYKKTRNRVILIAGFFPGFIAVLIFLAILMAGGNLGTALVLLIAFLWAIYELYAKLADFALEKYKPKD